MFVNNAVTNLISFQSYLHPLQQLKYCVLHDLGDVRPIEDDHQFV